MAGFDAGSALINFLGGGFGIAAVAAIFKFFGDRNKNRSDHELGVRAAEVSDEATALGGYDKFAAQLLLNQEQQGRDIKDLQGEVKEQREINRLQARQLTFRDIYVAQLRSLVPPPPPEPPVGYEV